MKIEKSKLIILIILLITLGIMPQTYAKTSIEIKPDATLVYTNKTISEFFDESMKMKEPGEGLEGSIVDVHMATNTDWAIVSYFSNSAYGKSGSETDEEKKSGIPVSINGISYLSTNGNITGVMNLGKTATYTAGVISNYTGIKDTEATEEPYDWGKRIIENAMNSKYVDLINTVSAEAMAARKWYGSDMFINVSTGTPFAYRRGLFGFGGGYYYGSENYTKGNANINVTFRPAIWN